MTYEFKLSSLFCVKQILRNQGNQHIKILCKLRMFKQINIESNVEVHVMF